MPFYPILVHYFRDLTKELEDILFRRSGPLLHRNDFEVLLRRTRPPCDYACLGMPAKAVVVKRTARNKENLPVNKTASKKSTKKVKGRV